MGFLLATRKKKRSIFILENIHSLFLGLKGPNAGFSSRSTMGTSSLGIESLGRFLERRLDPEDHFGLFFFETKAKRSGSQRAKKIVAHRNHFLFGVRSPLPTEKWNRSLNLRFLSNYTDPEGVEIMDACRSFHGLELRCNKWDAQTFGESLGCKAPPFFSFFFSGNCLGAFGYVELGNHPRKESRSPSSGLLPTRIAYRKKVGTNLL